MIALEKISKDNFKQVIALSLREDQKTFVQTNEYSIAQSYIYPEFRPMAVCQDGQPVGFLLWCVDEDEDELWIYRFMIDKELQHRGYGKAALSALIEHMKREEPCRDKVYISAFPENAAALGLYRRFGFVDDGRYINGEVVLRYDFR